MIVMFPQSAFYMKTVLTRFKVDLYLTGLVCRTTETVQNDLERSTNRLLSKYLLILLEIKIRRIDAPTSHDFFHIKHTTC